MALIEVTLGVDVGGTNTAFGNELMKTRVST